MNIFLRAVQSFRALNQRMNERAAERRKNVRRSLELKRLKRIRKKTVPAYVHCKNCGTELHGMYCHNCGQYALDINQPFWKYLKQYFENVYQFDSKVWITLWQLFRRPGFLTTEFNKGKIVSYVHPMRLLMFIVVVFFIGFFFVLRSSADEAVSQNKETIDNTDVELLAEATAKSLEESMSATADMGEIVEAAAMALEDSVDVVTAKPMAQESEEYDIVDSIVEQASNDKGHDNRARVNLFLEKSFAFANSWAPLLMLLMTPFLALFLGMFYRKKRMRYMEHLVFAMHWSSFFFILLFVYLGLLFFMHPGIWVTWTAIGLLALYTAVAMHQVYPGTSWIKSALKSLLVLSVYLFFMALVLSVFFVLSVYNGIKDLGL